MAQAVTDLFPGRQVRHRPRDRRRLLLRLRAARRRGTSPTTTSSASRPACARSSRPTSRSCARSSTATHALAVFADQPYKLEIIERVDPDDAAEVGDGQRHLACTATRGPTAREFVDLCRGPHVPSHQAARRVQAHQGRRRVLARRREAPDAPAHLRHRVGVEGRARGAPAPARGGREARPPQARRRARPVLVPRGDRLGPRGVPPEGRHRPQGHGGLLARSATRRPATSS